MKNVRLIITEKGLETLKAFAEENYLGNYIASDENDLYYKNILNFPDVLEMIKNDIVLFAKNDISEDDELVWVETMSDMKRKNATYYSFIFDTNTKVIKEFSNESGKIKLPFFDLDSFDKINKIENMLNEKILEEDLEI
jgi:uncharacterized protein YrzB (UPF0473 family)